MKKDILGMLFKFSLKNEKQEREFLSFVEI